MLETNCYQKSSSRAEPHVVVKTDEECLSKLTGCRRQRAASGSESGFGADSAPEARRIRKQSFRRQRTATGCESTYDSAIPGSLESKFRVVSFPLI